MVCLIMQSDLIFLDVNVLWIGTENGVSTMQNGEFSIINESNGLGHNKLGYFSRYRR
jgi:hypothetical protein